MKFQRIIVLLAVLALAVSSVLGLGGVAYAADMPYHITVDLTNQIVTIYDTETEDVVRQFLCSSGAKDATPTGNFTMPPAERKEERKSWFNFRAYGGYARYASRIYKDVMFHSLLYKTKDLNSLSKQSVLDYGYAVSHGCIRLRWQDAKFIAENCLPGTKVKIYKSHETDENLRSLLFQSSYTNENGQTYKAYLGIPEGEGVMGRYSEGEDVRNLQMRLRDLGIFTDKVDGVYGVTTVTAVRDAQALLGEEQTGVATLEFQEAIYSGSAPSAMNVTLSEGASGPAVRTLQENLAALGLYEGATDGIYDVDVVNAVKEFQSSYGYGTDGIAVPTVQKAIYYEAGRLKAVFALDDGYTFERATEQIYMGRVNCKLGIRVRQEASKNSPSVGKLRNGDVVVGIENGNEWCKVQKGSMSGYVMTRYIDFYPQDIALLRYTSNDGDTVYTIGYTKEDYMSGADRPADAFDQYLTSGGSLETYEGFADYVTVRTEDDAVTLNLREAPNTGSSILDALENGAHARVVLRSGEWSLVDYEGQRGYLLNKYLEFWSGPQDALQGSETEIEALEAAGAMEPTDDDALDTFEDDESAFFGEENMDGAVIEASGTEPGAGEAEGSEGATAELEDDLMDDGFGIEHAEVSCDTAKKADVYEEDSEDANVLGSLKNGTKVDVLRTVNGWSLISYQGHQGYMREMDLRFIVEGFTL